MVHFFLPLREQLNVGSPVWLRESESTDLRAKCEQRGPFALRKPVSLIPRIPFIRTWRTHAEGDGTVGGDERFSGAQRMDLVNRPNPDRYGRHPVTLKGARSNCHPRGNWTGNWL